jgi:chromosome segregation ATPase
MGWLIELLLKTRDTRAAITKNQALQNFSRRFNKKVGKDKHQHIEKMFDLTEKIKPKRAFKSTKIQESDWTDPKRVHSCLREFNDPMASRLYKQITEGIARLLKFEEREKLKNDSEEGLGGLEEVKDSKADSIAKTIGQIKKDRETGGVEDKNEFLDLNEAIMTTNPSEAVMSELDEEISKLKQKTFRVKAGDVNQILSQNINQLTEEVHNFQQMSEETLQQDEEFFIKTRKEELERDLKAFEKRKENKEKELEKEKEHLENKKMQYKEQSAKYAENKVIETKLDRDIVTLVMKISECPVTEEDLQKVYRKDQLKQDIKEFKKNCREERDRLESELERIRKKNEDLEKEEHAQMLKAIEDKYNKEYEKLIERKKKIAEQNRHITALQRQIENCPSKIELSQYHKRFTELYESINDKFEENRKYVSLFNTKDEVRQIL